MLNQDATACFGTVTRGQLPVAVPGMVASVPISIDQGTFLALSSDPKARALAAIIATSSVAEIAKVVL